MKNALILFLYLSSSYAAAEGINIFGSFIPFTGGEFYNPYDMNENERLTLNIVLDRSCEEAACYGKVIISPLFNTEKLISEFNLLKKSEFLRSKCDSNTLLRTYNETVISVYEDRGYNYLVMFVGSKDKFFSFEKKFC